MLKVELRWLAGRADCAVAVAQMLKFRRADDHIIGIMMTDAFERGDITVHGRRAHLQLTTPLPLSHIPVATSQPHP